MNKVIFTFAVLSFAFSGDVLSERERDKHALEQFDLSSLFLKRIVPGHDCNGLAEVLGGDDLLYTIKVGDYMGRNNGKIVEICHERIVLFEIVINANGDWEERRRVLTAK